MAVFMVQISWVSGLAATALLLALTGFFVGPTMVSAFTVAERRSPDGGTALAMTLLAAAVTVGVSLGSGLGGALAQQGPGRAYLLAAAASLLIVLVPLARVPRPRGDGPTS